MERSYSTLFEVRRANLRVLGHPLVLLEGQHVDAREVEVVFGRLKLAAPGGGRESIIEQRQSQLSFVVLSWRVEQRLKRAGGLPEGGGSVPLRVDAFFVVASSFCGSSTGKEFLRL